MAPPRHRGSTKLLSPSRAHTQGLQRPHPNTVPLHVPNQSLQFGVPLLRLELQLARGRLSASAVDFGLAQLHAFAAQVVLGLWLPEAASLCATSMLYMCDHSGEAARQWVRSGACLLLAKSLSGTVAAGRKLQRCSGNPRTSSMWEQVLRVSQRNLTKFGRPNSAKVGRLWSDAGQYPPDLAPPRRNLVELGLRWPGSAGRRLDTAQPFLFRPALEQVWSNDASCV